jgi:hypothetical protein
MPQIEKGLIVGHIGQPNSPNAIVVRIFVEAGAPATSTDLSVLNAAVGSLYLMTDGGAGSTLYVMEPSGWVAK